MDRVKFAKHSVQRATPNIALQQYQVWHQNFSTLSHSIINYSCGFILKASWADQGLLYIAKADRSSRATILVILIMGFTAGPAVSL